MSLFLLTTYFVFTVVYSQCRWQFGDHTLDLSCLAGRVIRAEDTDPTPHDYTYTICSNGAGSCGADALMCKQVAQSDASLCYEIGRWNPALSPEYIEEDNAWQFDYQNGESCNPSLSRSWAPTFVCNPNEELKWGVVDETFGSCRYTIRIETKFACDGVKCELDSSSGLSGGWIFIIILIVGFAVYFIAGYIVMATTVNKAGGFGDFQNNIPQRTFWTTLPSFVFAGCVVTKETVLNLMGKGEGSGS
eukprot:UN08980